MRIGLICKLTGQDKHDIDYNDENDLFGATGRVGIVLLLVGVIVHEGIVYLKSK